MYTSVKTYIVLTYLFATQYTHSTEVSRLNPQKTTSSSINLAFFGCLKFNGAFAVACMCKKTTRGSDCIVFVRSRLFILFKHCYLLLLWTVVRTVIHCAKIVIATLNRSACISNRSVSSICLSVYLSIYLSI